MGTIKDALLVAGWIADEKTGWAPWLIDQIETRGTKSHFCMLPHRYAPLTLTAAKRLKRMARGTGLNRIVICHSFGGKVALKVLSQPDFPVRALIMIAPLYRWPFSDQFPFWSEYINFWQVKQNCPKIIVIHSQDDGLVPIRNSEALVDKCQAFGIDVELIRLTDCGHFAPRDNCFELPEVIRIFDTLNS